MRSLRDDSRIFRDTKKQRHAAKAMSRFFKVQRDLERRRKEIAGVILI
jgi:hypothetical protein